jgi:hypothetical protein
MSTEAISLNVVRHGRKWWVGWPCRLDGTRYVLPTPEHDQLAAWWRTSYIDDPLGRIRTIVLLLERVDLAVRRKAPPVAFELVRLGRVVRTYEAEKQPDCTRNNSHFGGHAKTETATTRRTTP